MVIPTLMPELKDDDIVLYGGNWVNTTGIKNAIKTMKPHNINPIIARNFPQRADSVKITQSDRGDLQIVI